MSIDLEAFKYAVSQIGDGMLFERFATAFVGAVIGYDFTPIGGVKDSGIDGLNYCYFNNLNHKQVFQISTEQDYEAKLNSTVETLQKNKVEWAQLRYVTNREVRNEDKLIDRLVELYGKPVNIWDIKWFVAHIGDSHLTENAYKSHVLSNLHQFAQPGSSSISSDLGHDGRLYVFLRQQLDRSNDQLRVDQVLIDSLLIMSLEGTDPDEGKFLTLAELKQHIRNRIRFDLKAIEEQLEGRLSVLSKKPDRKIVYHSKAEAYCLPYETRLEIQQRNIRDEQITELFFSQTERNIRKYLDSDGVIVRDVVSVLKSVLYKIFHQQGLEFSTFITGGNNSQIFEKNLEEIISEAVDESAVIRRNRNHVKSALLMTIRDMTYNGTYQQKAFLQALSNSYMMMFLMHWEPKIAQFFSTMASQLKVFVCTSIIIPALSEYYLEKTNRRHWNLLHLANRAGVQLYITQPILDELATHFRHVMHTFENDYANQAHEIAADENQILFVGEILIRAYFYAKARERVFSFRDFIDTFVGPDLTSVHEDLVQFLKTELGISLLSAQSLGVTIDDGEYAQVVDVLKNQKSHVAKAKSDARTILTIYKLREKHNEQGEGSIFGYKTWWLSKDTTTYRAMSDALETRNSDSCYIRPDFLYNYIALAPHPAEVNDAFRELFPTMLGVNISYHLPADLLKYVQNRLVEFRNKNEGRAKAILRRLVEQLKTDPTFRDKAHIDTFLRKAGAIERPRST